MQKSFYVRALWDDDVKRWYSESDIHGLAIETDTLDEFRDLVAELGPDLVLANHFTHHDLISHSLHEILPAIIVTVPAHAA